MIIVKAASNAPEYIKVLLKIHVGNMEFENESKAINYLEKLKFLPCEIRECKRIRI